MICRSIQMHRSKRNLLFLKQGTKLSVPLRHGKSNFGARWVYLVESWGYNDRSMQWSFSTSSAHQSFEHHDSAFCIIFIANLTSFLHLQSVIEQHNESLKPSSSCWTKLLGRRTFKLRVKNDFGDKISIESFVGGKSFYLKQVTERIQWSLEMARDSTKFWIQREK